MEVTGRARPTRVPAGATRVGVLLAADVLALSLSGLAAHLASAVVVRGQSSAGAFPLAALVPLFPLSYALAGLYPGFGVSAIQLIRTACRQTSLVFLVIVGSVYALRLPGDYSRVTLVLWWAFALGAVPLVRALVSSIAVRWSWWREPVVLIGEAGDLEHLIDTLARARHIGYRPMGVVLADMPDAEPPEGWQGPPVVPEAGLAARARGCGVRTVLLSARLVRYEARAIDLSAHFPHVITVHALEDRCVEPVAIHYLGNSIGIEIRNRLLMRRSRIVKRTVDVVFGLAGLVVTCPFMLVAAVAIVVCDPGPWRHAQVREGRNGRAFRMWKLRTMFRDADARLQNHLAGSAEAREEWQREFKLLRDPRIIPGIGTFLRRWSLDECPQFWNVIRGDMSLVGPRALPLYHLEAFDDRFRSLRRRVRPGMTGMWQVMSRGRGAIRTQEALDSYYIYNWSIWMDVFILARTIIAVLTARGAR